MLELKRLLFPSSPVPESTENLAFNTVSLLSLDLEKFTSSRRDDTVCEEFIQWDRSFMEADLTQVPVCIGPSIFG